ncbi:hypothetical protein [Streptomyces sp. NPDC029526]|uniref:hypothetical protein n=1 Tax=Streptomyces sp. NPDC029526 TaxID=3155728 RepID=UPI0033F80B8D
MSTALDTLMEHGTGALPHLIRLADGPGYWLSVTSAEAPDGSHPVDGQYAWFDVLLGEYVLPPESWQRYADGSGEFRGVPSHLVRALIAEHGGERVGGAA